MTPAASEVVFTANSWGNGTLNNMEDIGTAKDETENTVTETDKENKTNLEPQISVQGKFPWKEIFLYSFGVFFIIVLVLYFRRQRMLRNLQKMNCRQIFAKFLKLVHLKGHLGKYTGTEENFASELAKNFTTVSEAQVKEMQTIVERAAFGAENITEEETQKVRAVYVRTAEEIRRTSRRNKKRKDKR